MKRLNRFLFNLSIRILKFIGVDELGIEDGRTHYAVFKDGMNPFPEPKTSGVRNIRVRWKRRFSESEDICEQLQHFYNKKLPPPIYGRNN